MSTISMFVVFTGTCVKTGIAWQGGTQVFKVSNKYISKNK